MYLLSQPTEEAGQLYIYLSLLGYSAVVAPLSRARPLLASVGCPDEWPSGIAKAQGNLFFFSPFWFLFYDGWRMTRRGVRDGDNSFT